MNKLAFPFLLFLLFLLSQLSFAQNFGGSWTGDLIQNDQPDTFIYQLDIKDVKGQISGFASSQSRKGGPVAKFEIGGSWDGTVMVLQEVQQLEPLNNPWCLKHIRLNLIESGNSTTLTGAWEAQNCLPGTITLFKLGSQSAPPKTQYPIPKTQLPGKWSGQLSQSDRDYGFYFEMNLKEDGTGTSEIISDGAGGNAIHQLKWELQPDTKTLFFEETSIVEKSIPGWRWCLKSGSLKFNEEENRLSLQGDWSGFLEGYTNDSGPCAPGRLYVERPVFRKEEIVQPSLPVIPGNLIPSVVQPIGVLDYKKQSGRDVEVNRVVEVQSRRIKIRVWDNGTIDGDILSLFLNGEILLKNHRATRRKYEIPVTIDKPANFLILHAINLGSITPNTVAVSVDDGKSEQVIMLSSTLKTSGAVMIREFTVR